MKKTLFAMIALIVGLGGVFSGCKKSPQERAEYLVKKMLENSLHDFSSYESVQFGTLDSTFSRVEDLEEYKNAWVSGHALKDVALKKKKDAELYREYGLYEKELQSSLEARQLIDSSLYYLRKCVELDSLFIPEFIGWQISHSFRANNKSGNKEISHRRFYFDKDLTKIVAETDDFKKQ